MNFYYNYDEIKNLFKCQNFTFNEIAEILIGIF